MKKLMAVFLVMLGMSSFAQAAADVTVDKAAVEQSTGDTAKSSGDGDSTTAADAKTEEEKK